MKKRRLRALRSGQYILGKECQAFEAELAAHTGTQHCVLGSSWTMIVYMMHLAQGLKAGDEVIVPSHTAFPTMEPLIHCGAKPVFADIDDTFCMDPAHVESLITPRTVGIIPVHIYGHPADLDRVFAMAAKHKLWVLEDCAQAHGASYKDKRVGSMGLAGAYSFFPSKNLTVLGDGGCLCTNDAALAERVRMYRNHGRKDKYLHEFAGFNVRFNEIQAAIGRVMLKHLDAFNENRRAIAARYNERLAGLGANAAGTALGQSGLSHVCRAGGAPRRAAKIPQGKRRRNGHPLSRAEPPATRHHVQFRNIPPLPRTEQAVKEILSLPIHGEMSLAAADVVCDAVAKFYGKK